MPASEKDIILLCVFNHQCDAKNIPTKFKKKLFCRFAETVEYTNRQTIIQTKKHKYTDILTDWIN